MKARTTCAATKNKKKYLGFIDFTQQTTFAKFESV